ncbi:MAG: VWA domain-containing protein [Coriobacteriia bacterium]|nr:VWA domain-containing protein [Coriobacteriia bacterium]
MKRVSLIALAVILVVALVGCAGTSEDNLTQKQAQEKLDALVKSKVKTKTVSHQPDNSWVGSSGSIDELPDINQKYPLSVKGTSSNNIEIFSSTEKSSADGSGWLDIEAKAFNKANSDRSVSVRPIASGSALGYITGGKYVPGAYSPANELWAAMLQSKGVTLDTISQKLTGNEAGILMKKSVYQTYVKKYGQPVTIDKVVKAVLAGDLKLAHTDPNVSSTGLNIMTQELRAFDPANPFSEKAQTQMQQFADKVPPVSPTTAEMVQVASKGLADAIITEYQAWKSDPSLKDWVFTPCGVLHNSPLYAFDKATPEQKQTLKAFADFCTTSAAQRQATSLGFNPTDGYAGVKNEYTGAELYTALDFWKQNKDAGKPVLSVFVIDRSGSMEGEPLNQLKASLLNGANYINENYYVGLVSFSSSGDITVDLPIDKFTAEQHSVFCGAVGDLQARGNTATNSALVAAMNLLVKKQSELGLSDAKLRVFLLSDGQQNEGLSMSQIKGIVSGLKIPIYTIGYNNDIDTLKELSSLNEAYCVNADSSDVVMNLKQLFTAQL